MLKKNNKDFEMQVYLKTCKENGIVLEKTNNKIKSNIVLIAEDGKKYYVSKDMSLSPVPRPVRRTPLKNGEFKKVIPPNI